MIPILYPKTETTFTSNGLGRLAECVSCRVTEERNGSYECEFSYPISGKHYADIEEGCFIGCTHDDDGDVQPFEIYRRSAPINGIVTFNARHLSYRLSFVILNPFSATNIADAFTGFTTNNINTNPFTFWTDKTTYAPFSVDRPASVRSVMGGVEGSILDIYGGEWEFTKWTVKLWANRGTNSGVTIRYGKNLRNLEQTVDAGDAYNSVVPYWSKEEEDQTVLVTLPEKIVSAAGVTTIVPVALDMSAEFLEQPTEAELRAAALDYLNKHTPWIPNENIKIDFIQLWQTTEYANVANLQKVRLCDTVNVYYPALGVTLNDIKVIKVVYNVLADRYDEMELGQPSATFADTIAADLSKQITKSQQVMEGFFDAAITTATELLSGNQGGHVVIKYDVNGKPQQILIMDTEDELTATNILRISLNGIGFSTDGGTTYSTAWTIDGHFVADYITTGTLRAILIEGPDTLTKWDLTTGIFDNHGESEVTAQVETAEGVYTPQTYDVDHITRISGGLLRLLATIDDAQTQTELFSLGLAGEGMSYDFYKDNNDSGSTFSYPYAGLNFNAPTVTGKSGIIWTQNRGTTATYTPYAHISPDTLVLGGYKNLVTQIAGEVPNRNPLHLNGGWVSPENAIFLEQHYQIVEIPGGTSKEWYDFKRRVAWEICPGDNLEIGMWRGAGIYSNSKKDIRLTIPLCRPISADVKTIEVFCTVNRAWQQGTAIVSANVDTSGSVVESWNLTGVVVSIRKDDGTAWSGTSTGTNNAPIAVQLLNLQLIFWGDEFSE